MNDMKCPFCQQKLVYDSGIEQWCCDKCHLSGGYKLWKVLINTRKALDIAVDALKSAKTRLELINNSKFANLNNVLQIQCQCEVLKINEALEQITAPKQKD